MKRKRNIALIYQARLPFTMRAQTKSAAVSFALERKAFVSLGVILFMLAALYSYFVMLSVSHVVVREELLLETETLSDEVARLEQHYLADSTTLTEAKALSMGFTRVAKQTFVERGALTLSDASR